MEIIINGEGCVLGRLASYVAKEALKGNKIIVVNSEKIIITGKKQNILERYLQKRRRGGDIMRGPFFPSDPEKILKRTIRGMLPYKQEKGRKALKRVKCYVGIPNEFKDKKFLELEKKKGISLEEISKLIKGK